MRDDGGVVIGHRSGRRRRGQHFGNPGGQAATHGPDERRGERERQQDQSADRPRTPARRRVRCVGIHDLACGGRQGHDRRGLCQRAFAPRGEGFDLRVAQLLHLREQVVAQALHRVGRRINARPVGERPLEREAIRRFADAQHLGGMGKVQSGDESQQQRGARPDGQRREGRPRVRARLQEIRLAEQAGPEVQGPTGDGLAPGPDDEVPQAGVEDAQGDGLVAALDPGEYPGPPLDAAQEGQQGRGCRRDG